MRNDTGVYEGGEISIFYDPMIAKLCTHGPDRASAIAHMSDALDQFYIEGIGHNIPFLSAIMNHERWKSGNLSTSFITDEFPDGFEGALATKDDVVTLALVAVHMDNISNIQRRKISGQIAGRSVEFTADRVVRVGDNWLDVKLEFENNKMLQVAVSGDDVVSVESAWQLGGPVWSGHINGKAISIQVNRQTNGYHMLYRGVGEHVCVYTRREAELAKLMPIRIPPDTSNQLLCPMPGLIVSVDVEVGSKIEVGQKLAVVEAMKMENVLRAERDGVVSAVFAAQGDSLAVDAVIMEFE